MSVLALGGAGALIAGAGDHPAATYFGAGGCLLVAGLAALAAALRRGPKKAVDSLTALAWANLARRPRAVVAATAVLAAGTFVVVGVGVSRHDARAMTGTGGFALLGESTLAVSHGLDTAEGLAAYGLAPEDLKGASVVPLRVRDGDDASCLGLAQAPRPTLYGVDSQVLAERRAFGADGVWSSMTPYSPAGESEENCEDVEEDEAEAQGFEDRRPGPATVVPAVGDEATLTWRLKLGVGDELEDVDELGRPYILRIVGVLPNSILQGGLIVDTSALAARFPTTSGDRLFLVDAAPEHAEKIGAVLTDALGDTGFVATPTVEILGRYLRVENTYLAIFLALGGLGLLLGAPGVGVLLFRQVLTRRRELAVLMAMG
ncbi:MAG: hypothetical protein QF464_04905, partial [Myxococcota bacterium]|nr:hypothetical protein [Myxococcota bacterium]